MIAEGAGLTDLFGWSFSVRIIKNRDGDGILIGAIEKQNIAGSRLDRLGWCINTRARWGWAGWSPTSFSRGDIQEGQMVTVRVDRPARTISFYIDGDLVHRAIEMDIAADRVRQLHPAVQIYKASDSVEIEATPPQQTTSSLFKMTFSLLLMLLLISKILLLYVLYKKILLSDPVNFQTLNRRHLKELWD